LKDKFTLYCLLSTVLLGVMNSFFFHIAIVPISNDLNISLSYSSWFILGYSIMVTIGSIVYSKLSESIQLKTLYIFALFIFSLFSVFGFFSDNFFFLILCRLAQGIGGAAFITITMIAVMDVLDRKLLPIGLAFISLAMTLGSGLGPLLSGILLFLSDWHILFLFMSCTFFSIPILCFTFPKIKVDKKKPFDWIGMFYLLFTLIFLLVAVNINFLFILLFLIFLFLLNRHIQTISHPIINRNIFNNRLFIRISGNSFLLFFLLGANVFLLSFLFSSILSFNSIQSGLILLISSLFGGVVSIVVGKRINNKKTKRFYRIGIYFFSFSYLIGIINIKLGILISICCFIAFSVVQIVLNFLLDSALKETKKIYIGIFNLCNFIGMSIGVAVFSKLIAVFHVNVCFIFLLTIAIIKGLMINGFTKSDFNKIGLSN